MKVRLGVRRALNQPGTIDSITSKDSREFELYTSSEEYALKEKSPWRWRNLAFNATTESIDRPGRPLRNAHYTSTYLLLTPHVEKHDSQVNFASW